ncbi:hypothetical protein [Azospirillum picis]|uniref:Uncharacterized protein n=1 Tax=Azospirillum picis TaxID=488438 RepID=A0ABU0MQ53_9PROT|nr:hypothetical protein [Azospirillum picis]MBP2302106.1 hypothetical protein [Azospirillum picis]MDQ0535603.1 hypothetical protein [Azospirillum picis]
MGLADRRRGSNGRQTMSDTGLAAFPVFFMQSPSFLSHRRGLAKGTGRGRSNAHTLSGLTAIPSDNSGGNHLQSMLDGVPSDQFDAVFATIVEGADAPGATKIVPQRFLRQQASDDDGEGAELDDAA